MKTVTIYTDGACSGNPGPGGYGVVLLYGSAKKELSAGYRLTTNNRMELMAAIAGLEALNRPGYQRTGSIEGALQGEPLQRLEVCGGCDRKGLGCEMAAKRLDAEQKGEGFEC